MIKEGGGWTLDCVYAGWGWVGKGFVKVLCGPGCPRMAEDELSGMHGR